MTDRDRDRRAAQALDVIGRELAEWMSGGAFAPAPGASYLVGLTARQLAELAEITPDHTDTDN